MTYEQIDAEDFLEIVYGDREGWIDLPAKVGRYWVPFHTEWPADGAVSRRIDSSLRDREDLYYSVAQFAQRGRRIEDVLPAQWLWADLDEVHPTEGARLGLLPTVAVESSPGRFQGLWRLTRPCSPKVLEKLNRALSYALEADRGGWDLTQVLRIPGTRNFKYPDAPIVRLLWHKPELVYDPKAVWAALREVVPEEELRTAVSVVLPRKPIPARARALLRTPTAEVVEGERSARLWELECLLLESGLTEEETFELVWRSAWNKWAGIASGRRRLSTEIHKAAMRVARKAALKSATTQEEREQSGENEKDLRGGVVDSELDATPDRGADSGDSDETSPDRLPFVSYSSFMAMRMEAPRWLVEDIWTAGSHGIIGGEPKTLKTALALALGISVASGRPFLGQYPVGTSGPVLMVQEENAPWMMQDRARKIAAHLGLISRKDTVVKKAPSGGLGRTLVEVDFPVDIPFRLLNNYGFDLAVDEHRDMLEAAVEEVRPVLLLLDPLYLVLGGANENQSHELRPFFKWLLRLRYEYNCAIAVVHHMRKQSQNGPVVRAGQRILGSTTLHGWSDAALYTTAMEEERKGWVRVRVEREFRAMAPLKPLEVALHMGDPGSLTMNVEIEKYSIEGLVIGIVRDEPGVTARQIAERLGIDKRTVLGIARGSVELTIKEGQRGRGKSHQIFPAGNE